MPNLINVLSSKQVPLKILQLLDFKTDFCIFFNIHKYVLIINNTTMQK